MVRTEPRPAAPDSRHDRPGARLAAAVLDAVGSAAGVFSFLIFVSGPRIHIESLNLSIRDFRNPAIAFFVATAASRLIAPGRRMLLDRAADWIRRRGLTFTQSVLVLGSMVVLHVLLSQPPALDGDALGHYAYLRSLAIDGDLDFTNEFSTYRFNAALPDVQVKTTTGLVGNTWPIGLSLLWAPLFFVAHAAAHLLSPWMPRWEPTGYSPPYQYAAILGNELYGLIGLVLIFKVVRTLVGEDAALPGTIFAVFGTPVAYYVLHDPGQPHVPSLFAVSLFVWFWLKSRPLVSPAAAATLGSLAGLTALIRFQDGLVILLPLIDLARLAVSGRIRRPLIAGTLLCASAAAIVLPQVLVLHQIYGGWQLVPQGPDYLRWTRPAIMNFFFSWRHGAFSWTPLVVVCLLGLAIYARRAPEIGIPLVLLSLAQLYVDASVRDWWGGSSFGARRLSSLTVVFALGLAILFAKLRGRLRLPLWVVCLVLTAWNLVMVSLYRGGRIPPEDPVALTEAVRVAWSDWSGYVASFFTWHGLTSTGAGKDAALLAGALLFLVAFRDRWPPVSAGGPPRRDIVHS